MIIPRIQDFSTLSNLLWDYINNGGSILDKIFIEPNGTWHYYKYGSKDAPKISLGAFIFYRSDLAQALNDGKDLLEFINGKLSGRN